MYKRLISYASLMLITLAAIASHAQDTPDLQAWTRFNTIDPQVTSDFWLTDLLANYSTETNQSVENTFYPFDQINTALNIAVQTGVNVPDIAYIDTEQIGFYSSNGTLLDLTEFVQNATWAIDLDPLALATCTAPTGEILCIPASTTNYYIYYWIDVYTNGYPSDTSAFLEIAPDIKAQGYFPITFKAADAVAAERFYIGLLLSYGAQLTDADGNATWANDDAVEAIQFIRDIFAAEYVPDVALAPQFEYEEPFKQGLAASFVAGTFSYVYLSPLTSPGGEEFVVEITGQFDRNAISVGQANEAGELAFAPPLAAPDSTPVSIISSEGWAIPFGATNVDAALAFIDYQMNTQRNTEAAIAGGKLPVLTSSLGEDVFTSDYWSTAAEFRANYGSPPPAWLDYGSATRLLSIAIVNVITNPDADIMDELQQAQDEYNLLIEDLRS